MSQLLLEPWRDLLIAQPWLAWIWITLVGACIGSFLNVVIYRLPARMSLSRPGSHCPRCQEPIRWYDNIPIVAWCWLRGRCRNCQLPISIRYPLVELLIALLFATQWYLDVGRLQSTLTTDDALLQAIARFALHSLWLVVLVVFTGIDADGQPAPRPLLIFTTITILFGNEWIQPSAARDLTERISHQGPVAVTTAVLATLTGLFDGRSTRSIKRKKKEINATPEIARSEILAHAIIGGLTGWMAKGWQGVGLVVVAVGMAWVGREAGWPRFASRWWMWLLVATLLSELAS